MRAAPSRQDRTVEQREEKVRAQLEQVLMTAFCSALSESGLPPITVLRLAAVAVGAVYRNVSQAHQGEDACQCGWRPDEAADLEALRRALGPAVEKPALHDLRMLPAAGRA